MLLSEEEAKTKLCPEMIDGVAHKGGRCLGSACMAWRWHAWLDYSKVDNINEFVATPKRSTTHGYCGKAGKPLGSIVPSTPE